MYEKSLVVNIAEEDFSILKKAGYSLCFSKYSADEGYNMVWLAEAEYGVSSQLIWKPRFAFFLAAGFADGKQVITTVQSDPLVLGQECTLLESGMFSSPRTGTIISAVALVLQNRKPVYPGLSQYCGLNGREEILRPACLAKNPVVSGMDVVYPQDKILVWFEQETPSGMMFEHSRSQGVVALQVAAACEHSWSKGCEVDLRSQNEVTILYRNMSWSKV